METESEAAGVRTADQHALWALSVAYAAAADARNGEEFAALFTEDGALVVPRPPAELRPVIIRSGHAALVEATEFLGRYYRTFHLVSSPRFEVDGDEATGDVPCVAHHVSAPADAGPDSAAGTDTVWFIRYHDRYRRTGPEWRIVRRELHLQWVEEHPVALLGPPPDRPV